MRASVADGREIPILGKGDIGALKDVLYVPDLKHCLISASSLLEHGYGMYAGTIPKIIKESDPGCITDRVVV